VCYLFIFVLPTIKQKQEVCMQRDWKKGSRSKADLCFKQAEYSTPMTHSLLKEYAVWPFQGNHSTSYDFASQ
jgi:hypothetical protein